MDEVSRLVSELHNKLAALDERVWNYRRDMAAEFAKFAEDLLRTVPQEVSETVSKIIVEDLKDYKSLNPDAPSPLTSGAAGSDGRQSSAQPCLADLMTTSSYNTLHYTEQDSPQNRHEREREFQGLFTPSYLPLLDYTSREIRTSPLHSSPLLDNGKGKEMDEGQGGNTHTRILEEAPELERRAQPVRRNTDELSISSDRSDGQVRRSALRRSSDNSKQSPRRVRFDFMGEEVLPTSSPQHIEPPIESVASYLGHEEEEKLEPEQIEVVDDSPLPQKRVSTTDALRVLSRQPLEDDGTQWITVSSGPDGEPVVLDSGDTASKNLIEKESRTNVTDRQAPGPIYNDDDDPDTASEDGMDDMPPLSPMRGTRASPVNVPSPILSPTVTDKSAKPPTSPGSRYFKLEDSEKMEDGNEEDLTFMEEDEDALFRFDEAGHEQKKLQEEEDSESSESAVEMPSSRVSPAEAGLSLSPALAIPSRTPPEVNSSSAPKPSVGSYKGHPFNLPIVSEELHSQAASLGAFNSFVGSVDGRSGLDPSDAQSFRESLKAAGSFTGAPRSMMERMMMEDLLEAEKEKAENAKKRS